MIPVSVPYVEALQWKNAYRDAIKDPIELFNYLDLPTELLPAALRAKRDFPLRVPRGFAARMEKGNPMDPLLLQILPLVEELNSPAEFVNDPVGDWPAMPSPGLLHKYSGRVLLVASTACAIHCRYCFRRYFPYHESNPASNQWQQSIAYIARDHSIKEVILSGGDPLSIADSQLNALIDQLAGIPHLECLRIHTRLPVVIPQRITPALVETLGSTRLKTVIVLHINHANEIDHELTLSIKQLGKSGTTLLNQSVLLHRINDNALTLCTLSEKLFDSGVLPYYLHLLDRVRGTAHFEVPEHDAKAIYSQLRQSLPGYLVPKLVREIDGELSKRPVY